ncbi:beta strand repeat-containing protein [Microbulbifer sp. SSSA008]|uniref:beta strand repeat-containing protein n=1 Tax=Microbulbifer sp. SSSA008 TaxID=3243380 RepID=UPI0040396EF1
MDEEVSPWQLSIVGASTGDVVLSGDEQALSLGISEVCVAENLVSEDFSSSSSEDLASLGFHSFGGEALSVLNERVTVTAQVDQVLLAPTVLSDSSEITLSAFINSSTDVDAGTDSLSIYLTDAEYVGYGVQYQGDGTTGVWALVHFTGVDSQINLAHVSAAGNHPTSGQAVTLNRSGDTFTATVGGADIGLSYTVGSGIGDLSRYGIRATSLEIGDNNYLDNLTLTFSSSATCPALADTGDWDDAYSLHFVYQELLQQGELIARLSSHSNSGSGIAGIALRNGTAATDKAVALVMDPADNSIGLFTRDTDDAANTLITTGQTGALPQWLRLVRDDDTITAYISTDGVSWTQVDSVSISFDDIVKAGIAVAVTGSEDQSLEYDNLSVLSELSGDITTDIELAAHQTYLVTGNVDVNSGVTLTINEGATILFEGNYTFEVNGSLTTSGGVETPVVFTSAQVSPVKGDWYGIMANDGGSLDLSYTTIEYADYGLYAKSGSNFSLNNSTLRHFDEHGIYAHSARGSIKNSTIQYADNTGVYLYGVADFTVSDNTITDNQYGFYIKGISGTATTPTITGNTITGNSSYGLYLYGVNNADYDPQPVITGNSIYSNSSYDLFTNYYESGALNVDASGNWWNTTDPESIAAEIYDYTDSTSYRPIVDYSGYLDAEDGSAAVSYSLLGYLTRDTTLEAGNTYTLLSTVQVQSGVTLTIEPGARIEAGDNFRLKVFGALEAQGTSDNPIVFTSDKATHSVGDWYGIVAESGGTVTLDYVTLEYSDYGLYADADSAFSISNSTLQYFDENAVYAYKSSGSIHNNIIQYADIAGVSLYGVADLTVRDNLVTNNQYGFYVKGYSGVATTPAITGNTVTGNSRNGFYLHGTYTAEYDPQPVITGNSIHSNSSYDLQTYYYESGALTVDATSNWWNTTDAELIAAEVYDYSDSITYRPVVDYSGFLDAEDGDEAISNGLLGFLAEDTTLVAGTTYTLLSTVYVKSDVTLTIEPGARIEVGGNFSLRVLGTLDAQGTSDNPIVFTSDESTPSVGDWVGIVTESGGTVTLDYVTLEYGDYGLYAYPGSTFSLSNSTLQYFDESGVYAHNASGTINNNTIQHADNAGVYLYGVVDATVSDNTITNNNYGFYIKGYNGVATTPTITGNTVTGNSRNGFYLHGVYSAEYDPQPVITGNSIHSNSNYDLEAYQYETGGLTINATGNWWNTTDAGLIAAEVYDYTDSATYRPIVDYSGYLDAEDGSIATSNGLIGFLAEDTTLVAGTTYTLLNTIYVESGVTLTIEPGARIEVGGNFRLKVSGTLDAQGTSDSPIVFTSDKSEPSVGDWYGIVAESGGTVTLDYVTLEYGDYGLYANSGSTFSLSNSTLQYFDESAVYAYIASGSINSNIIQYADNAGVYLYGAGDITASNNVISENQYGFYIKGYSGVATSPTVTGNTLTNNNYGFHIQGYSGGATNPTITGNTITGSSSYGFYLNGVRNAEYDPQPVITGNSIHSNNSYDLSAYNYESGVLTLNATGNWWNTTDSGEIGAEVYDYTDSTSYRPLVDYSGYLDAEDGSSAINNGLIGYLTEDTTLVADTTYTLLSTVYVKSDVTLTIEPGARIEVGGDFSLKVSGTLDAQGTSDNPIVFTSDESTPSVGDWVGIVTESGGTVTLDYVTLEYGDYGLYAYPGSTFSLSNSTLQYFDESGVYAHNASATINNNTIQHADNAGVYLYGVVDATVSDNTITNNNYGFYIKGYNGVATTPTITGNTVTGNSRNGFYLHGVYSAEYDPQPVITGNSIHSNSNYDLEAYQYETGGLTINATGNWWNTTDAGLIAAEVYDYTDSATYRPIVDYSGYLDAEDGSIATSNGLIGFLAEDTTLVAGTTYTLLNTIYVESGVTLTIEPGARIEVGGNFRLKVSGTLDAQGTSDSPIVFTSDKSEPSVGDWYGIVAESGGTVTLDYVMLEYGDYGLYASESSTFSLSNSTLQYFDESAVYAYKASGTITNNTIQHADVAGVYLYGVANVTASNNMITESSYGFYVKGYNGIASTPTMTGNTLTNNNYGFHIQGYSGGATNPTITGNTITGSSSYGFYLNGVRNAEYDPQPVITGNSIHGNNSYDLSAYNYESGVLTLNATGNWWNTTDSGEIATEVYDYTDSTSYRPLVDYSGYLDTEDGSSAINNGLIGYLTEDTTLVADTTYTLLSTVYVKSDVTLTIEPGARIEVGGDFSLKVSGTLDAQGTSDNPIVFTSDESTPSVGDWYGIVAENGGTVALDYVALEYGDYGLYANSGSTFSLSNSTLQYFDESAIYAYSASGSITSNTIQYADNAGVYLYGVANVTVSDNTITNNNYGFYIKGYNGVATTPTITGNTVTGNSRNGFYLHGVYSAEYDPQPVITGNSIHSNSNYDLEAYQYETGGLTINATGNWWNTTDSELIAAEVYDYTDSTTYRPIVDYSGYLDSEDGSSAVGNVLNGYLTEDATLLAGTTYTILSTVYVQSGVTLTIEPGARIEVGGGFSLQVAGTLDAQGTSDSPIVFTSDKSEPSVGDWYGIVAESGGTVALDYVTLEYGDYGLYANSGSTFSLSNSTLQYFDESAVYAYIASGSINSNIIQYADNAGISLYGAGDVTASDNVISENQYGFYIKGYSGVATSPTMTGNTLTNNNYGFHIQGYSGGVTNPTITGNTITGSINYGFSVYGVRNAEYDPQPVITGNSIHSNNSYDLYTNSYESGVLTLNATGNWWNTTDSGEIATEVYDYTDSTSYRPLVDYSGYLDTEDGSSAINNGLIGYLTEDTTLVADTTYTLLSTVYVKSDVTLTIEPGARIEVGGDFSLKVSGTLDAQGTSDNPIVFTSDESTPSVGDWVGIVTESGGTVTLDYVTLEYGDYGLYAYPGSTFSLSNSTLQYFDESGVYAHNASATINNNTIQHADNAGVYLYGVVDATVSDNTITNNNYGFYIKGYNGVATTPTITGNTVTGNSRNGFYLHGVYSAEYDPQPVITGNSIHSNSNYDLEAYQYETGGLTINATGNWWNTTDAGLIAAEVYDYTDSATYRPIVDYSGYLDAEDGSIATSNGLIGFLAEDTTLVAGTTYTLLNTIYVESGVTLTIEPGARIEVGGNFRLKVSGTLDAQGTSDSPIVFTSDKSEPSVGDWYGIVAESGGTVTLDYVTLEYGDYGLYANSGSTFSLSNSTLQYFDESAVYAYIASGSINSNIIQYADNAGVYLYGAGDITASNNVISENQYGFYIKGYSGVASSPTVTGNTLTNNNYGFHIQGYSGGATNPTITGNTITGSSSYGFYLNGVRNAEYDPQPVITGNSIHSNNSYDLSAYNYESGVLTLNATGNWWNTTDSGEIGAEVYDYTDSTSYRPLVDYSGYLDAEDGSSAINNGLIGYLTEDTTLVSDTTYTLLSTVYVKSDVTLTIEPGARIEVGGDFSLKVSGTLDAQGTSDNPIVFTSDESTPSVGDWYGIVAENGGTVTLDYVTLEYGDYGLYANSGSTFSLSNSTLQYFDESGVYAHNASGTINNNTIQHADNAGVYLYGVADATVSDNTITNNYYGFSIKGYNGVATTPTITGNTVTGNSRNGFYLHGVYSAEYDPQPVITGNSIHSNSNYDLEAYHYETGGLTINATGNWWNTTDAGLIAAEVYDYTDSATYRPIVDYSGYLDAEDGSIATSNGLIGFLAEDTTLVAGTTYTLLNTIYVESGVTLTIEPGARIEVGGNFRLKVSGTLDAQGTSDSPIVFTSDKSEPSVGDWYGIVAESGGTVTLDYVTLEYGDYGLYANSGSTFSLSNSTLQYFDESAVYAYQASGTITNNTIQYADVAGVSLYGVANATASNNTITGNNYGFYIRGYSEVTSTPSITGNLITDNDFGFYIQGYSGGVTNPTITGNTVSSSGTYGFYLIGVSNGDYDPSPIITGNSIHSNSSYELYTNSYESGVVTVDATGNWWNTTDSGEIAAEIFDHTDSTSYRPLVDYSGYLDAEDGSSAISNGLNGYLSEDTTLEAGNTYTLLSTVYVQSGVTLTIEPGARIEVGGDFSLKVFGTLDAQGTSDNPIVFTSDESTPSVGDWYGIVAESGGTVILDYVTLEYGDYGLYANSGSTFSLSNSTLQYFDESAIHAYSASGSISSNTIQHADNAGVYLYGVTNVTASDNVITDNQHGFYIKGYSGIATTPTITGNTVTDNSNYGFYLYGMRDAEYDPQPEITGNSIHSNGSYDLYTYYYESGVVTVNATGNWWNTLDSGEIQAEVYDYSDSTSYRPLVDYSGYLSSANGNSVYDHYLRLDIDTDTSLAAGSYIVVDDINVNSGVSLTLEAGAILVFPAGHSLTVEGDLVVSGSSLQPVIFTSEAQYPVAGDWQGIVVASGGSISIDNAYIQYAETAVSATSPSAFSVTNSIITDFSESGISINNFAGGTIVNNLIQNTDYTGTGIALDTASPAVTDNVVTGLNYGAYITGASSPSLTGNSFIDNNYGIYLNGSGSDATNPTPTIIGNDLYGNTNGSLYLNNYGSSSALVLNVTGNWWGSAAPEWGVDIIGVDSPETAVDYSNALAAETRVITSNLHGDYQYFSPNSDGNQDTLAITGTLSSSSSWSLEISNESGTVVNTFSGTGTDINIDWDGTDSGSTVLNDGRYYLFLKVTDAENTSYRAGAIWVELDNTAPIAEMSNVNNGDTLSTGTTTLEIEGSAIDNFFVDYTMDYQLSGDTDNWVSLISSTAAVSENILAEWVVSSTDGTVEAPANGDYQIRLVANDRAGNISTIIRTVTIDLVSIANVSRNQTTVNPVSGENLVISFDLSAGATVTLDIKDEQTEVLVRSVVETFDSAGSYSLNWDGKDGEGNYVQEEAYTYDLTAVSGGVEGVYAIENAGTSSDILIGSMDSTMNAAQNDFMKAAVTPTSNVRVYMEVTPSGGDKRVVYDNVPMEAGAHYLVWDGRTADGVLTSGSFSTYVPYPEVLPTNVVIIDGITPSISGTLDAPNIEVKSDPYLMYHSYDQISKVAYLLDQDSYVTFKLLPPDIGDPTDAGAITLIDNQLQAANDSDGAVATHEVEWTGYEESDGNAIMVSDEGVYSFWIEATSATTGASTTYYGALQLYQ